MRNAEISDQAYRDAAKAYQHRDGECEIDDLATVSRHDDTQGAYVQAWVWVSAEELAACQNEMATARERSEAGDDVDPVLLSGGGR